MSHTHGHVARTHPTPLLTPFRRTKGLTVGAMTEATMAQWRTMTAGSVKSRFGLLTSLPRAV
jgi:hypothetical protein